MHGCSGETNDGSRAAHFEGTIETPYNPRRQFPALTHTTAQYQDRIAHGRISYRSAEVIVREGRNACQSGNS